MPKPYVTGRSVLLSVGPRPHRLGLKDLQRRARYFRKRYQLVKAVTFGTLYSNRSTADETKDAATARSEARWLAERHMDAVRTRELEIERGKA